MLLFPDTTRRRRLHCTSSHQQAFPGKFPANPKWLYGASVWEALTSHRMSLQFIILHLAPFNREEEEQWRMTLKPFFNELWSVSFVTVCTLRTELVSVSVLPAMFQVYWQHCGNYFLSFYSALVFYIVSRRWPVLFLWSSILIMLNKNEQNYLNFDLFLLQKGCMSKTLKLSAKQKKDGIAGGKCYTVLYCSLNLGNWSTFFDKSASWALPGLYSPKTKFNEFTVYLIRNETRIS